MSCVTSVPENDKWYPVGCLWLFDDVGGGGSDRGAAWPLLKPECWSVGKMKMAGVSANANANANARDQATRLAIRSDWANPPTCYPG
jgi:hypothetical protein